MEMLVILKPDRLISGPETLIGVFAGTIKGLLATPADDVS